jgi:hypothetical protein
VHSSLIAAATAAALAAVRWYAACDKSRWVERPATRPVELLCERQGCSTNTLSDSEAVNLGLFLRRSRQQSSFKSVEGYTKLSKLSTELYNGSTSDFRVVQLSTSVVKCTWFRNYPVALKLKLMLSLSFS